VSAAKKRPAKPAKKAPSKQGAAKKPAAKRAPVKAAKRAAKKPAAKRGAPPVVRVSTEGGPFRDASATVLRRRAEKMLGRLALRGAELSVALVDDATIHELNRRWRKKDKPTDVLSFALGEGEDVRPEGGLLGDVILSVETARRQAAERRRPLLDELTMLLAHGILHLVGYDHRTDAEEAEMNARTRELEAAASARG
jgi:probable rRNA maturation factor